MKRILIPIYLFLFFSPFFYKSFKSDISLLLRCAFFSDTDFLFAIDAEEPFTETYKANLKLNDLRIEIFDVYQYKNILQINNSYSPMLHKGSDYQLNSILTGKEYSTYNDISEIAPIIKVKKNEICRKPSETKYGRARQKRLKLLENCNLALARESGLDYKDDLLKFSYRPEDFFWIERTSNSINNQIITGNVSYKYFGNNYEDFKCFDPNNLNDKYLNN